MFWLGSLAYQDGPWPAHVSHFVPEDGMMMDDDEEEDDEDEDEDEDDDLTLTCG